MYKRQIRNQNKERKEKEELVKDFDDFLLPNLIFS
jgi:hypothetical protein